MNDEQQGNSAEHWNTYWQGAGDIGAYSDAGVTHPAVASWWATHFNAFTAAPDSIRMLDVATGNGAVLEVAIATLGPAINAVTCVDISAAAIKNIEARFPQVTGLVTDARNIPLDDAGFDLVVSQFGVEYAGVAAIAETARLVAAGGRLTMLLHTTDGVIYEECASNYDAVQQIIDSGFVPRAEAFFAAGFAAVGGADRRAYDEAGAELAPAISVAETVLTKYGEDIAGGTVARLYGDVGRIHEGLPNFDADEVLGWIRSMQGELSAFTGRMASMQDAALDESAFRDVSAMLASRGFDVVVADALYPQTGGAALGWVIDAKNSNNG